MASPTILDFYRYSIPRGTNLKQNGAWTTTSSSSIVTTAASGKIYFVQGISIFTSCDSSFGANSMTITHSSDSWGGVASTVLTFPSIEDVWAAFAPCTERVFAQNCFGYIMFEAPSVLDPGETLTIAYSGGTGGITSGHVKFGVSGWWIAQADL